MEQRSRQIESNKSIFLQFDRVGVTTSGHLAEAFWHLLWKLGPLRGLLLTDSLTSLKPLPLRVFLFDFSFSLKKSTSRYKMSLHFTPQIEK